MKPIDPSELIKLRLKSADGVTALAEPVVLEVPRLSAAPYADIADAILAWHRKGSWTWRDRTGATRAGRRLLAAGWRLVRDAVSLPFQLVWHYSRARRCIGSGRTFKSAAPSRGGLYLRMDHLFDLESGGSVAHTAGVINTLRELSSDLTILSTDHLAMVEPDGDFHVLTPRYGIGRNVPLIPTLSYSGEVLTWWQSRGLPRPGFIYARYSVGNYVGPELRRRLDVPYVCEYNGSALWIARNWGGKPLRFERVFQAVEDANLLCADVIVAVSEASKAELVERGYDADRILVNPNGVDPSIYRPDIDGRPVRRELGIRDTETVIGFIGTFGRWHGAEVLADAFGRLLTQRPDLRDKTRLLLIGDGMTMPLTRQRLEEHGVLDRALLPGLVPQKEGPSWLAACDILASPHVSNTDDSRFFGSPTKLFEYMSMGRAIVASDLEQIGEVLEHEETALLVPQGDAGALANALARLIEGPELRAKLAAGARRTAIEKYSWLEHTRRILDRLAAVDGARGKVAQ